jgi:hypothetical protein
MGKAGLAMTLCSPGRRATMAVGAVALALLALVPGLVAACTIDSVPSAIASGRTAVLFTIAPASVDPAHYAPFIFPGSFGAGWSIHFGELPGGLTLTVSQSRAPWRWTFGDGATGWGHSVTHAYRRPGLYVLTVSAFVPHEPPFPFDRILVRVLAPSRILAAEGANLLNGSRFAPGASLFGGLLPLRREVDAGVLGVASQTLGQIESGAWASIRDYWLHTRGALPPAYVRVDDLLRQEGAALDANNQRQAAAIAAQLPAAWAHVAPPRAQVAWLPLGGGAAGLLLALLAAGERWGWRARRTRTRMEVPDARRPVDGDLAADGR